MRDAEGSKGGRRERKEMREGKACEGGKTERKLVFFLESAWRNKKQMDVQAGEGEVVV